MNSGKPRVLLLSATSGAGHVRAAEALEKAFLARGDSTVEHIDALRYVSKLFERAYDKAYLAMVRRAPELMGVLYERTDQPWRHLRPRLALDRLNTRRTLLEQLDDGRRALDDAPAVRSLDRFQDMAYSLITSPRIREALDISQEPPALRDQYGMSLFGQATLAGRRLLEAGATVVSVFWDEIQTANSAWDTHFSHFERLKDELLPGLDRAFSTLLVDLEQRGMLDDTLVLCLTEHGRTPRLSNTVRGAGREHWSEVYCNLVAGAGIARGRLVGSSDKNGAFVKDDPVSPKDILCTTYHLLGIDPHQTIPDRLGRPIRLVADGDVHPRLLG